MEGDPVTSARPAPRWWRRSRDEAISAALEAQGAAGLAFFELDNAMQLIPEQVRAAAGANHSINLSHPGRPQSMAQSAVGQAWERLKAGADQAIAGYLELDSSFNRSADHEEAVARRYTAQFNDLSAEFARQGQLLEQFKAQYSDVLAAGQRQMHTARQAVFAADAAVDQAVAGASAALAAGVTDAAGVAGLRGLKERLAEPVAALADHQFAAAEAKAAQVQRDAEAARAAFAALPQQVDRLRNSHRSVQTRVAALHEKRAQLGQMLKELKAKFPPATWTSANGAPQHVSRLLLEAQDQIEELGALLAAQPIDVPRSRAALERVRATALQVDTIHDDVFTLLRQLNDAAFNPVSLVEPVSTALEQVRARLVRLPGATQNRFAFTVSSLGKRVNQLTEQARARADLAELMREAQSVQEAVAAFGAVVDDAVRQARR